MSQQLDPEKQKQTAIKFDAIRKKWKQDLVPTDYPGTVSLIFELDTRICLITNDGETILGELSSWDKFGNVVISKAKARAFDDNVVHDTKLGVCYFRSDQIALIGQIDKEKEKKLYGNIDDDE